MEDVLTVFPWQEIASGVYSVFQLSLSRGENANEHEDKHHLRYRLMS
jgi:hypothetical protein